MKLSTFHFQYFLFLLSLLAFSSCTTGEVDEAAIAAQDSSITLDTDTTTIAQDFFYSLPSPMVMVKMFKRSGLKYIDGLANSTDYASRYTSIESQTLNLGVYSTDLTYAVVNKQNQQASKYMEAIKTLATELGMSSLFDPDNFLKRFKNNLNNEDSLTTIISELKCEMDIFIKDNEKEKQSVYIFIGAWVENLYLATQATKDRSNEKVSMRIAEQKYMIDNLMNAASVYQNEAGFNDLFLELLELKSLFNNLSVQEEDGSVVMDEKNLNAITQKINTIRATIIK